MRDTYFSDRTDFDHLDLSEVSSWTHNDHPLLSDADLRLSRAIDMLQPFDKKRNGELILEVASIGRGSEEKFDSTQITDVEWELVLANTRLARKVVFQTFGLGIAHDEEPMRAFGKHDLTNLASIPLSFEERMSCAIEGLERTAFQVSQGKLGDYDFSTFAVGKIFGVLTRTAYDSSIIHVPEYMYGRVAKLKRGVGELEALGIQDAGHREAAFYIEEFHDDVIKTHAAALRMGSVSLEWLAGQDDTERMYRAIEHDPYDEPLPEWRDEIVDGDTSLYIDELLNDAHSEREVREIVMNALSTMRSSKPRRDLVMIALSYPGLLDDVVSELKPQRKVVTPTQLRTAVDMLDQRAIEQSHDGYTLEEIGSVFARSKEQVRQVRNRFYVALRQPDFYDDLSEINTEVTNLARERTWNLNSRMGNLVVRRSLLPTPRLSGAEFRRVDEEEKPSEQEYRVLRRLPFMWDN